METINLLRNAVMDIDNLEEYYLFQFESITQHVNEEIKKYKYGFILDRYFFKLTTETEEFDIPEKDKNVIDDILEIFEITKQEESVCIKYRLKNVEKLKDKYELDPYLARTRSIQLIAQPDILNESTLMMILVKYEEAIAGIYRFLVMKFPDLYLNKKSISYSEFLSSGTDIEDIKKHFVDKEVEEFMRSALKDWYNTFSTKHKMNFSAIDNELVDFKEMYYRRNIFVHNQGVVNEVYVKNVENTKYKIGESLKVDKNYIEKSFRKALIVLYGTFWELIKISKLEHDNFVEFIFDQGYNYMVKEKWDISKFVFKLLMQDNQQAESNRLCNKINYWISIKNSEGIDEIKNEIEKLDVSAMKGQFIVAKYALLDDFENVSVILDKIIDNELPANYIEEWPLFIQYRTSEEYKKFKKDHAEIFEIKGYTPDNETVDNENYMLSKLENVDSTIQL